jgi:hypothetical protein
LGDKIVRIRKQALSGAGPGEVEASKKSLFGSQLDFGYVKFPG